MPDVTELMNAIKTSAVAAVEASKPVNVVFGKVTSASPLTIQVEQKLPLDSAQLILTRNVTDFQTEVTVDWLTENRSGGSSYDAFSSHNHEIKGRKKITVHNALKVGDEVVLIRQQGGQKFIVLDRLG